MASYASTTNGCGYSFDNSWSNKTVVLFVNGITNTATDACASSDELSRAVGSSSYDRDMFYNPTDGFLGDTVELQFQAAISSAVFNDLNITDISLLSESDKSKYYSKLGAMYSSLKPSTNPVFQRLYTTTMSLKAKLVALAGRYDNIVLVAHSQGNFYTESAYSMLVNSGESAVFNKIHVVGVAVVAATTPNGLYITNREDLSVFVAQVGNALPVAAAEWFASLGNSDFVYKPLPSQDSFGYDSLVTPWTVLTTSGFHSFNKVYLSDNFYSPEKNNKSYRLIIRDYVQSYLNPQGVHVSNDTASVGDTISIWFDGAYQAAVRVVWSFGAGIANQVATLLHGLSDGVSQVLNTAGVQTITATLKNLSGEIIGQPITTTVMVLFAPTPVITNVTSQPNPTTPGTVVTTATTSDTSLYLNGTLDKALTDRQVLNVYDNGQRLSEIPVVSTWQGQTTWFFWFNSALSLGSHSLTARVESAFDGTPLGEFSAPLTFTIVQTATAAPTITTIFPPLTTINTTTAFAVTGQNLPLTAVMSIEEATCQTPTNRTTTGFTVVCTMGSTAGSKIATIKTDLQANGGTVIDATKTIFISDGAPTIFSNYGTGNSFCTTCNYWNTGMHPTEQPYRRGMSFTVPSGISPRLSSINLTAFQAAGSAPATLIVSINKDSGGLPGAVLEQFVFGNLDGSNFQNPVLLTGTSIVKPILSAGTQYWLTTNVSSPTTMAVGWVMNNKNSTGVVAWSAGNAPWSNPWGAGSPQIEAAFSIMGN